MSTDIDFCTVFPNFGKIAYMYNHKHNIYNNNVVLLITTFKHFYDESEFKYEDIVFSTIFKHLNEAFEQFKEYLKIKYLNGAERPSYVPQNIDTNEEYKQLTQLYNQNKNINTQNKDDKLLYKTSMDDYLQNIKILYNNTDNKITIFLTKFTNFVSTINTYNSDEDCKNLFMCMENALINYANDLYRDVYKEFSDVSQSSRNLNDILLYYMQYQNGDIEYKCDFEQEEPQQTKQDIKQDLTQQNNTPQNILNETSNTTTSYALISGNSNNEIIKNQQKILKEFDNNDNNSLYSSTFSSFDNI